MILQVSLPIICFVKRKICSTLFLGSIVVSIPACHVGDRGSIPRRGEIIRGDCAIFWLKENLANIDISFTNLTSKKKPLIIIGVV